jgi:hypothetical protein
MTVTVPHLVVRSVTDNSTLGHQQLAVTRIESVRVVSDTVLLLSVLSRERHWNFSYGVWQQVSTGATVTGSPWLTW